MSSAAAPAVTAATRRVRLFRSDEVARHTTASDVWVMHNGNVYNVTEFVMDHPGGDDLVMRYAGKEMGTAMEDPEEHSHSESAYGVLAEYLIGRLAVSEEEIAAAAKESEGGAGFSGKDAEIVITNDFKPSETDESGDYQKHKFLDLSKPLILQVWNAKFNKEFYLQQVHSPRHLKEPARLFGPAYLEMFTRTPWYVVPMVWVPIAAILFHRSATQFAAASPRTWTETIVEGFNNATTATVGSTFGSSSSSPLLAAPPTFALLSTFACFLTGIVIWTMLEYGMHRFLFHVDDYLPDRPFFLMLHFLLHGIHHYLPMDRLRLVMPPLLFAALSYPFTVLAHALFIPQVANGIISGAFAMYVCYDMMHYALHHTKLPAYVRDMKKYHLEHHYKNYELGFGVTSRFWDWVFGTEL